MRAKRRIYLEKEKRLSTSYLRLLIILDFGYFSEWSLCPGGRYAPGYTVEVKVWSPNIFSSKHWDGARLRDLPLPPLAKNNPPQ